jgi:hypothetical protein
MYIGKITTDPWLQVQKFILNLDSFFMIKTHPCPLPCAKADIKTMQNRAKAWLGILGSVIKVN